LVVRTVDIVADHVAMVDHTEPLVSHHFEGFAMAVDQLHSLELVRIVIGQAGLVVRKEFDFHLVCK
jgi:hypothetical protein